MENWRWYVHDCLTALWHLDLHGFVAMAPLFMLTTATASG